MKVSAVVPTHNPDAKRLRRALDAFWNQSLAVSDWELLVIDNASSEEVRVPASANTRVIREPELGLTAARRRGFREARGEIIVLVDDDNVLAPDYLEHVVRLFSAHPRVGALGGRSLPEFEIEPPAWVREFDGLLACRDLGTKPMISQGLRPPGATRNHYPAFAPIGAGMALQREAVQSWLEEAAVSALPDRRGGELTSGGDNDIVLTVMRRGWEVGYFPELILTHLIPPGRTSGEYLARLNRGIAKSWVQVLSRHDACPWPPVPAWTVPLRKLKAWFRQRAWSSATAHVRWQGACGHFEALGAIKRS